MMNESLIESTDGVLGMERMVAAYQEVVRAIEQTPLSSRTPATLPRRSVPSKAPETIIGQPLLDKPNT
jgi:hypothetical protein